MESKVDTANSVVLRKIERLLRKLNFLNNTLPDDLYNKEENLVNNFVEETKISIIPGSPAVSSCSEGEPPDSPIENYSPILNGSRSPIISSSISGHYSTTNETDVNSLRILLKESQYKLSTAEAEIKKLQNKLVKHETGLSSADEYAAKLHEKDLRLHESERALILTRQDLINVQEMVSEITNQNIVFEQKYIRAKKIVRDLRTDITSHDEFYQQLLQEKDTETNALVKTLKDRVIALEVELMETQKRFGVPVRLPYDRMTTKTVTPQLSYRKLLPLFFTTKNQISDTDTSDLSSPDDCDKIATVERKILTTAVKEELDQAIPAHCLLDNSAGKSKAELASRGGLANRQLPKRPGGLSNSSSEYGLDETEGIVDEDLYKSGICHDNNTQLSIDSIFKNANSNFYSDSSSTISQKDKHMESIHSPLRQHSTISSQIRALTEQTWQTSQRRPLTTLAEQLKQVLAEKKQKFGNFDTSSRESSGDFSDVSNSQSNDPPLISHQLVEEIKESINETNLQVKKSKNTSNLFGGSNTLWHATSGSPSSLSSGGSISPPTVNINLSNSGSREKLLINSGDIWLPYNSVNFDLEDKKINFLQKIPIIDWSKDHVSQWLVEMDLAEHISRFSEAEINGIILLRLESRDLKALGISGNKKIHFKRKLKELRTQLERERKERKEIERIRRKAEKAIKKK